jgi:hypothetical protein
MDKHPERKPGRPRTRADSGDSTTGE